MLNILHFKNFEIKKRENKYFVNVMKSQLEKW